MAGIVAAGIGGAVSLIGGFIGSGSAKRARRAAEKKAALLEREISALEKARPAIVNPYAGITDISDMAQNLSGMVSNAYANLGVATQAAEMQAEQSDIALANTLDALRASGSSAGGATALAQAALQSKKDVSANIEQQEAQNEKLKAQGKSEMERIKMSEAERIQGIQMSEAQRMQQADVAGKQYMFEQEDARKMQEIQRKAGQEVQQLQSAADAKAAGAASIAGAISGIGNIASAYIAANTGEQQKVINTNKQ